MQYPLVAIQSINAGIACSAPLVNINVAIIVSKCDFFGIFTLIILCLHVCLINLPHSRSGFWFYSSTNKQFRLEAVGRNQLIICQGGCCRLTWPCNWLRTFFCQCRHLTPPPRQEELTISWFISVFLSPIVPL